MNKKALKVAALSASICLADGALAANAAVSLRQNQNILAWVVHYQAQPDPAAAFVNDVIAQVRKLDGTTPSGAKAATALDTAIQDIIHEIGGVGDVKADILTAKNKLDGTALNLDAAITAVAAEALTLHAGPGDVLTKLRAAILAGAGAPPAAADIHKIHQGALGVMGTAVTHLAGKIGGAPLHDTNPGADAAGRIEAEAQKLAGPASPDLAAAMTSLHGVIGGAAPLAPTALGNATMRIAVDARAFGGPDLDAAKTALTTSIGAGALGAGVASADSKVKAIAQKLDGGNDLTVAEASVQTVLGNYANLATIQIASQHIEQDANGIAASHVLGKATHLHNAGGAAAAFNIPGLAQHVATTWAPLPTNARAKNAEEIVRQALFVMLDNLYGHHTAAAPGAVPQLDKCFFSPSYPRAPGRDICLPGRAPGVAFGPNTGAAEEEILPTDDVLTLIDKFQKLVAAAQLASHVTPAGAGPGGIPLVFL